MECPRCRKNEFSPDGICLSCNYKIVQTGADTSSPKDSAGSSPSPDAHSRSGNSSDEIPPWQKALAQRLEALKEEKRMGPAPVNPTGITETPAPVSAKQETLKEATAAKNKRTVSAQKSKPQSEAKTPASAPQKTVPQQKTIASLGEKVLHTPGRPVSDNIKNLIDTAVSRQSTPSIANPSTYSAEKPFDQENKFILLSRTLSGLIDMIFVIFCTGAFIIAADSFSGIVILDGTSIIEYSILFLLIFFLYSVFFLAASGQTIGMMITDLRIVGIEGSRPSIGQLFIRCFGYLLSVILLGAGLLWSFFDRKNRCFHDRFSDTSIIRI